MQEAMVNPFPADCHPPPPSCTQNPPDRNRLLLSSSLARDLINDTLYAYVSLPAGLSLVVTCPLSWPAGWSLTSGQAVGGHSLCQPPFAWCLGMCTIRSVTI
jgi:hypothetical protein